MISFFKFTATVDISIVLVSMVNLHVYVPSQLHLYDILRVPINIYCSFVFILSIHVFYEKISFLLYGVCNVNLVLLMKESKSRFYVTMWWIKSRKLSKNNRTNSVALPFESVSLDYCEYCEFYEVTKLRTFQPHIAIPNTWQSFPNWN